MTASSGRRQKSTFFSTFRHLLDAIRNRYDETDVISLTFVVVVVHVSLLCALPHLSPFLLDMTPSLVILTPHTIQFLHVLVFMVSTVANFTSVHSSVAHFHTLISAHNLVVLAFWHLHFRKTVLGSELQEIVHPLSEEINSP